MQELAERVLQFVRRQNLLAAGDRVAAAVSGGADSVGLLRILLELRKELGIVLSVVHFNHGLRGDEGGADEQFVAELAKRHQLPYRREAGEVKKYAAEKHWSVEAAGRKMRYAYFERLLAEGVVNRVATGHTLDDQAETVLMRLARGAGTRGLAGIYPQFSVLGSQFSVGREPSTVIRPLLGTRRKDLELYLRSLKQEWREDSSNRDLRFARNRVRHGILPRLERALNPAVREALAETAEIARAEEEYWEELVAGAMAHVLEVGGGRGDSGVTLKIPEMLELPLALRRRVVRAALQLLEVGLEFRHVEEVLEVARGSAKAAVLPHGWTATRSAEKLRIEVERPAAAADYEYHLRVPGRIELAEVGITLEAVLIPRSAEYNPQHCLEPSLLARELKVRNWRAGDRFWPAHTKAPKKIKELLQDRHLTGPEKKRWPVVVSGDDIVWVRGLAVPARFQAQAGKAVVIREVTAELSSSGERATT